MSSSTAPGRTDFRLIPSEELRGVTTEILGAVGLDEEGARNAADALVTADLRGVDSHGVSNMLRSYIRWIETGHVNPRPEVSIVREAPATMVFDSDGGLGIAVAPRIMSEVISRARTYGIAFATTYNARHLGMLAYTSMLALPHDMIGICGTAGGPRMVPTFGREARLGTNPISIAVPAGERPPFVFDSASTVVPVNKLTLATRLGTPLPAGILIEPDGQPVTEPRVPRPDDFERIAPVGSHPETASHKGYGLAASVDILCSLLSGASYGFKAGHDYFNHFFAALDVAAFNDLKSFKAEVDEFLDMLNATPPAEGRDGVIYAGQAEWETYQRRTAEGIPLHEEVIGWFREHCGGRGIDASVFA